MKNQPVFLNERNSSTDLVDHITLSFKKIRAILWEVMTAHEVDSQFTRVYMVLSVLDDMLESTETHFDYLLKRLKEVVY